MHVQGNSLTYHVARKFCISNNLGTTLSVVWRVESVAEVMFFSLRSMFVGGCTSICFCPRLTFTIHCHAEKEDVKKGTRKRAR